MPRAMWRGAIQFGLVTIPVRLFLATETRAGLAFNMLHAEDHQRIQMKVHCPDHGEIPRSDTVRGYEWSKGQYVVLEEADFESVPLKTVRSIEIEQFVPVTRERGGAAFVKSSYYLEPEPVGRKAFQLLKAVLADSGLQAICKIVLKDREQLAALDPFEDTMMLSTLYWPDEVRDAGDLDMGDEVFEFKQSELDMARQLVEALTGEFEPERYKDEYREALLKVIDSKIAGQPVEAPEPEVESSKLTDLMAVLEASVAAAREDAAGTAASSDDTGAEPISVEQARAERGSGKRTKQSTKASGSKSKAKTSSSTKRSRTSTAKSSTTARRKSA